LPIDVVRHVHPGCHGAGMVVSIEPPVFVAEERIGTRIIDNVLVTGSGAELPSTDPLDLLVVDG